LPKRAGACPLPATRLKPCRGSVQQSPQAAQSIPVESLMEVLGGSIGPLWQEMGAGEGALKRETAASGYHVC
jgi:hypothetical protein